MPRFLVSILTGDRYDFTVEAKSPEHARDEAERLYDRGVTGSISSSEVDHHTEVETKPVKGKSGYPHVNANGTVEGAEDEEE